MTSWRLRTEGGGGWVREYLPDGTVIVTGMRAEAHQWPTLEDAVEARDAAQPTRVRMVPVEGPATERYRHGE